jgi:outer membrane protein OmpA-like peptidoglycan-associated protein
MAFLAFSLFPLLHTAPAQTAGASAVYSPIVNVEALRGLSTVGSAESMGAGRITFSLMSPWYLQQQGYVNTPNTGANLYTVAGAFSYGVNSYVDLFASIAGFASNNYITTNKRSGLGTMRAGVQGSLPFPLYSILRVGGQTAIIGGTSGNQINTFRADGYNYFETRTGYAFMGKALQTIQFGNEDQGFKAHLNEAGVFGITKNEPALLCLGAGLQANLGYVVIGTELNSRTRFNSVAFRTDPLWFTPSFNIRTPFGMNAMAGIDLSLSANRPGGEPRALEPYRVFGSVAFSLDMPAGRRNAEFAHKEKAAQEKLAMERNAVQSAKKVGALIVKSENDSTMLSDEQERRRMQMDVMQKKSAMMALQASADSVALIRAAGELAVEKEKRSDAENRLLSTGELLLDAVYFTSGDSTITINSKPYLNIIGKMLLKYPKLQIEVAGHTDNIGNVSYNAMLSRSRADAVRSYLVAIAPDLTPYLEAHGYGMSMPTADNGTKVGRQANRRVVLRVLNRSALDEYSAIEL